MQALLPPERVHPFVVHAPALSPQQALSHPPAPADVLSCDLAKTMTQLSLLDLDDPCWMALGAAILTHHTADLPLRYPVTLLQNRDGPTPAFQAQKFPVAPQGALHSTSSSLSIGLTS